MHCGCNIPILINVFNLCSEQLFLPLTRVLLIRVLEFSTGCKLVLGEYRILAIKHVKILVHKL